MHVVHAQRDARRALEEEREVPAFVVDRGAEAVQDLGHGGITQRRAVVGVDHAVAVQVAVFDVARQIIGHEGLPGRVVDLLLRGEQPVGDQHAGDGVDRMSHDRHVVVHQVAFILLDHFVAREGERAAQAQRPVLVELLVVDGRKVDAVRFHTSDIAVGRNAQQARR